MKANDFISDLGDMLGEDFTYNPIWTRSELLGYLRKTLRKFAQATMLVDGDSLRYVDATTGESNVPDNFLDGHYMLYDGKHVDEVQLGELDFVIADWVLGTTATQPKAATVYGSGREATVRLVPVPSGAAGPYGLSAVTSVTLLFPGEYLTDEGGNQITDEAGDPIPLEQGPESWWTVSVSTAGVPATTEVTETDYDEIILAGPTTYWTLGVDYLGNLTTTATSDTDAVTVWLTDDDGVEWVINVDDSGTLTTNTGRGKVVRIELDGVDQEFTSDYGIITNAYATGTTVTPDAVVRLATPFGLVTLGRVSEESLHIWYKGLMGDVPNTASEIHVNNCFIPIIQHGVLALAFNHDGQGRDKQKAKLLDTIFELECESVRRIFNRK